MAKSSGRERWDYRQDLTNQIIDLIEKGAAPWQKPWDANAASAALEFPHNAATGRAYRGMNVFTLMARQQALGSDDSRWCTYDQAAKNEWQVRKGEKATWVEYWQFEKEEERDGQKVTLKLDRPRVFYAKVFHASQIDGMPAREPRQRGHQWETDAAAESIIANSGAKIFHDQVDRAFYAPGTDEVHLPPREGFPGPLDYYEVAMHELGHWTGHASRLKRDLTGTFGSESYAREELRAQMASLYLSAELGVPFDPERHASYQASWVAALKKDKNEIFHAAKDAEKMADYLIDLARERTKDIAQEVSQMPAQSQQREAQAGEVLTMDAQGLAPALTGTTLIDDNEANSIRYDRGQQGMSDFTYDVSFYNGSKVVAKFKGIEAGVLPDLVGEKNANAIINSPAYYEPDGKKILKGEQLARESGMSQAEVQRRLDAKELRKNGLEAPQDRRYAASLDNLGSIGVNEFGTMFVTKADNSEHTFETTQAFSTWAIENGLTRADRDAGYKVLGELAQARKDIDRGVVKGMMKEPEFLGPDAKLYAPGQGKQYEGKFIYMNENYAVQLIGKDTAIVHDLDKIGRDMSVEMIQESIVNHRGMKVGYDPARTHALLAEGLTAEQKRDRLSQSFTEAKAHEQETELTAIVHGKMGNDVNIVYAKDNTGRNEYDGPILEETGSHIIQKLNDNQVVIHSKVNLQHDVEVGTRVAIVYEHGKTYVEELSADKDAERAKHDAQERGKTAREQIKERFGDAKVIDAKIVDIEKGSFTGTIVAEDDNTVIQRIGANKFIAHQKQDIAPSADVANGKFIKIDYAQGKAHAVSMQKGQQQQKGQERELART